MKRNFLLLAGTVLLGTALLARADDVALLQIKLPTQKALQPVAIEFYEGDAPATVANFKKLAKKGYYKGMAFHRAFPHVLVQTGDPLSRKTDRAKVGTGGPGYTLQPEIRRKHGTGAVSMARLPDKINPSRMSNGSQFFVCLSPMPSYDGQYTVFGHVIQGLPLLDQISAMPVDSNDYPVQRVVIRSVKIVPREKLPAEPKPAAPGTAPAAKKPWWKIF
jgi:cyclophilin family peptidyl-prolyl cis-trans isomerase